MGKISPVSAKYIVHSTINIDGSVERPDVIGAIFGQTEGFLGPDLELRELQRSGKIGRIDVKLDVVNGKTNGKIILPSSLDKTETAIIAAALETIERIGPCNSRVKVEKVEDVRISKRDFVLIRAKELLKDLQSNVLPDSQEITDEVSQSVMIMEITEWGRDRLPAGPTIDESEEIILVEGRADVLNLLKHGMKNVIGMNGTNVPDSIRELCKQKSVTVFVDGDRGGDLIVKELFAITEIDYITKAPDGKEVEELTKKEVHIALRNRVTAEQFKLNGCGEKLNEKNLRAKTPLQTLGIQIQPLEIKKETSSRVIREERAYSGGSNNSNNPRPGSYNTRSGRNVYGFRKKEYGHDFREPRYERHEHKTEFRVSRGGLIDKKTKENFRNMLDNLVGTRGASLLDKNYNVLGKVPAKEIEETLQGLKGVFVVVFDGVITKEIARAAERAGVNYVIAMGAKIRPFETKAKIFTHTELTEN